MTRYIIILYKTNQNILLNLFFNQSSIKGCIFLKKKSIWKEIQNKWFKSIRVNLPKA
jgi:hypothetical protein